MQRKVRLQRISDNTKKFSRFFWIRVNGSLLYVQCRILHCMLFITEWKEWIYSNLQPKEKWATQIVHCTSALPLSSKINMFLGNSSFSSYCRPWFGCSNIFDQRAKATLPFCLCGLPGSVAAFNAFTLGSRASRSTFTPSEECSVGSVPQVHYVNKGS